MVSHKAPGRLRWSRIRRWLRGAPAEPIAAPWKPVGDWENSADAALMRHLYGELKRVTPLRASYWIMNPAWYQDIRSLKDAYGQSFWYSGPCSPEAAASQHLLGVRVRVSEDASVPMLVPFSL